VKGSKGKSWSFPISPCPLFPVHSLLSTEHALLSTVYIVIHYPLALFQGKNFIFGQKSLRRNDLTAILITFKNRPHFGARAEISENDVT
jgi:hypothetical protein